MKKKYEISPNLALATFLSLTLPSHSHTAQNQFPFSRLRHGNSMNSQIGEEEKINKGTKNNNYILPFRKIKSCRIDQSINKQTKQKSKFQKNEKKG